MASHSSTLAWKIPWTEEPGRLQSMGSLRVGHDWVTSLSLSCIGEGNGILSGGTGLGRDPVPWTIYGQFSRSVNSDSLWPHGLQHARPPCPSPTPEFTQTHVHRVGDAIQPSYPLSSPSPPAPNSSQHQSLFQWVNSLHEVAKVLEFQLQHQSFQWTPRTDFL